MLHSLSLFIALGVVWLLLSGHYNPLMLAFGTFSCAFTVFLARRFDIIDRESHPLHLWWHLPRYLAWLVAEIVKANIDVGRRILHPDLRIDPVLFEIPTGQPTDLSRVIYANSITLTPGTISLDVTRDMIIVHALTAEGKAALETGGMGNRVAALEG